jgi:hypothetical protein
MYSRTLPCLPYLFVIRSRTRLQQLLAVESRERAAPVNHCPAAIGEGG